MWRIVKVESLIFTTVEILIIIIFFNDLTYKCPEEFAFLMGSVGLSATLDLLKH